MKLSPLKTIRISEFEVRKIQHRFIVERIIFLYSQSHLGDRKLPTIRDLRGRTQIYPKELLALVKGNEEIALNFFPITLDPNKYNISGNNPLLMAFAQGSNGLKTLTTAVKTHREIFPILFADAEGSDVRGMLSQHAYDHNKKKDPPNLVLPVDLMFENDFILKVKGIDWENGEIEMKQTQIQSAEYLNRRDWIEQHKDTFFFRGRLTGRDSTSELSSKHRLVVLPSPEDPASEQVIDIDVTAHVTEGHKPLSLSVPNPRKVVLRPNEPKKYDLTSFPLLTIALFPYITGLKLDHNSRIGNQLFTESLFWADNESMLHCPVDVHRRISNEPYLRSYLANISMSMGAYIQCEGSKLRLFLRTEKSKSLEGFELKNLGQGISQIQLSNNRLLNINFQPSERLEITLLRKELGADPLSSNQIQEIFRQGIGYEKGNQAALADSIRAMIG